MSKKKIILAVLTLVLISGGSYLTLNGNMPVEGKEKGVSISCESFNKKSNNKNILVSGVVQEAGMGPTRNVECDLNNDRCKKLQYRYMYADIKPLGSLGFLKKEFRVNTEPEPPENFVDKPLHLQVGKKYKFCAWDISFKDKKYKKNEFYRIEFVDSITEIK